MASLTTALTTEITVAYLHFVALIGTASFLVVEAVLCRPDVQGAALHRLKSVDVGYFSFAIAALLTGAMRVFWGAKGSAYYLANPVFHTKIGLFVAIALLSIVPTRCFIQWSKAARADPRHAPDAQSLRRVRNVLRLELILLAALPLLATSMAHGISSLR